MHCTTVIQPPPTPANEDAVVALLDGFNKLKINQGAASGFVASKCNVAINCGFTANFPAPFMRPQIVNEMLAIHIADSDINEAVYALKAGLTVGFLPYKFHETNRGGGMSSVSNLLQEKP